METQSQISELISELRENTRITKELLSMLQKNNYQTERIFDFIENQESFGEIAKSFVINVGANILGNKLDSERKR